MFASDSQSGNFALLLPIALTPYRPTVGVSFFLFFNISNGGQLILKGKTKK